MQQYQNEPKNEQQFDFSDSFYKDIAKAKTMKRTRRNTSRSNTRNQTSTVDTASFIKKLCIIGLASVTGLTMYGINHAIDDDGIDPIIKTDATYIDIENLSTYEEEGYLPAHMMNIYDADGNPIWTSEDVNNYNSYYFYRYSDGEEVYIANGLGKDTTWEEFVNVYGEYNIASIYYTNTETYESTGIYKYDSDSSLTVSEFHEQYIETGEINLDTYEIDIDFEAYMIDDDIVYDYDQYIDLAFEDEDVHGQLNYSITWEKNDDGVFSLDYINLHGYLFEN